MPDPRPFDFDVLNQPKAHPLAGPAPRQKRERQTGVITIAAGVWLGLVLWSATIWAIGSI